MNKLSANILVNQLSLNISEFISCLESFNLYFRKIDNIKTSHEHVFDITCCKTGFKYKTYALANTHYVNFLKNKRFYFMSSESSPFMVRRYFDDSPMSVILVQVPQQKSNTNEIYFAGRNCFFVITKDTIQVSTSSGVSMKYHLPVVELARTLSSSEFIKIFNKITCSVLAYSIKDMTASSAHFLIISSLVSNMDHLQQVIANDL